ncbi:MAG: mannose-6-phosphate isomerase, class I [Chitinophagaceae bacterium]|nr:mannose-6-phosphate isomerase, class I [Chitinophagaceae bacterium]
MQQGKNVFKLKGKIQQYAWGGTVFLSKLLSVANPENKPFAEYWLGAHDNASSELDGATPSKLNEYIRQQPDSTLGGVVAKRFSRLPYLLKVLDVKDMLSIQVHPTKKNAEFEFAAENEKGVALTASHRNYKDDNHKPELMLALSDFWLLHGFKPEEELMRVLATVPELRFLEPVFSVEGYKGLYRKVMEMPQQEVNAVLQPLLDRIVPLYKEQRLRKQDEDFWAARAALTYNEGEKIDRGIFSIYFFNLVNVLPGEAVFQDAGLPHAYLEGQNVEIMANSDNVLRGGLTPKHVDVPELLKHVRFEATHPRIIREDNTPGHIVVYKTPAPDFELSKISLQAGEIVTIQCHSVEIFLVLEGKVQVEDSNGFSRITGEAFIAFDKTKLNLRADKEAVLYRASVPQI